MQSPNQILTNNKPTPNFYRPDVLPVTQPTVSKHWRERGGQIWPDYYSKKVVGNWDEIFWQSFMNDLHLRSPLTYNIVLYHSLTSSLLLHRWLGDGMDISVCFNGHFPGGPGLAGTRMYPFWILLELRVMQVVVTTGAVRRAITEWEVHISAQGPPSPKWPTLCRVGR